MEQSKEILTDIAQGKYNNSQMAAFMTAYCMRSITVNELEGFRDAMLELCFPVDLETEWELIDFAAQEAMERILLISPPWPLCGGWCRI